jgi:histidyl-tRNA synthetase
MIGRLLGKAVPATGFSIGFERVIDILSRLAPRTPGAERRIALLLDDAAPTLAGALRAAQALRAEGHLVALERQARSAGAQRAALEKQGYDGVATVTADGRASIQWFAERARREPGSGA